MIETITNCFKLYADAIVAAAFGVASLAGMTAPAARGAFLIALAAAFAWQTRERRRCLKAKHHD